MLVCVVSPDKVAKLEDYKKWRKESGQITNMLNSTLHKVRDTLLNAGLNEEEQDPFIIYTTVLRDACDPQANE